VIGRAFDFALIAALYPEESKEVLLDLVAEAAAAAVVREAPGRGERYEFSDALIGQTLAEELPVGRRIRLHARIVTAIEELHADNLDEHLIELAYHCTETVVEE
jgi:predicted ATPase